MLNGISRPYHLDESISNLRVVKWLISISANSAKPDQKPRSVASNLVFHCLPMSINSTLGLKLHTL